MLLILKRLRTVHDFGLQDLDEAVKETLQSPSNSNEGMAPVYGMNAKMPDRSIVGEFLTAYQDALLSA